MQNNLFDIDIKDLCDIEKTKEGPLSLKANLKYLFKVLVVIVH